MVNPTPGAMSMVLVDLPNFYNGLVAMKAGPPEMIKPYFLEWLDLNILANFINFNAKKNMGTWVFYSDRAIGPRLSKIGREELREFINRQNRIVGVSAFNVGIPGSQKESHKLSCEGCGKEIETCECGAKIITQLESEKGIDSSLITHLFETIDSWTTATIVSQDADYSPAVRALRRKGKIVYGAGFPEIASSALITECYGYIDILKEYLLKDLELYSLFRKGGKLSQFVKSAYSINKTCVYNYLINSLSEGSGIFEMRVVFSGAGAVGDKDNCDRFINLARAINKEFPYTMTQTNDLDPAELKIRMNLSPSQKAVLSRAKERYLDFLVRGDDE